MILRRVISHFRNQEWTAIFLDFLIVVIGVFVGLQVQQWNDARQTHLRELHYIALLKGDVSTMKTNFETFIQRTNGREAAMLRVLHALETCSPKSASRQDFERTFTEYQNILTVPILDATYNEMLASGALTRIEDFTQRRAIAALFTRLNINNSIILQIRDTLPTIDTIVWAHVRLSYDDDGQPVLAEYNFEELCKDPRIQNAVVEMIDMQHDWNNITGRSVARIADLEAELGKTTNEPAKAKTP
jgi:hypothetical protein